MTGTYSGGRIRLFFATSVCRHEDTRTHTQRQAHTHRQAGRHIDSQKPERRTAKTCFNSSFLPRLTHRLVNRGQYCSKPRSKWRHYNIIVVRGNRCHRHFAPTYLTRIHTPMRSSTPYHHACNDASILIVSPSIYCNRVCVNRICRSANTTSHYIYHL